MVDNEFDTSSKEESLSSEEEWEDMTTSWFNKHCKSGIGEKEMFK